MDALKNELKGLILRVCEIKDVRPEDIDDHDYLINGSGKLRLTSLDAVEIAVAIDRVYGVRIRDTSAAKSLMRSLHSLAEFVAAEVAAASRPPRSAQFDLRPAAPAMEKQR